MDAASSLQATKVQLAPQEVRVATPTRDWIASFALLGAFWLLIWNQQRLEWSVNPTYAYGWAVPLLAGYLFYERWNTRPNRSRAVGGWGWLLIPALLLIAYLPVRVVQEANPDWVKINWIMAGLAIGVSLFAVFAVSGWRGALHCAFPILFCMTALPWPVWMEDNLTKSLMQWNATACAEVLTLAGFPALSKGNLILVGSSWVNVEEACSGVRSLQTAFMVSLFFGEFYRFGWVARALLMLSSFALAFVLNFGRTVTLTYLGGAGGNELADKWHDTVGNVVMILCLAGLWLLAEGFQRWRGRQPAAAPTRAAKPRRAPFPFWFAIGGIAWLGTAEAATEGWYRYHEREASKPVAWDLAWPDNAPAFQRAELGERSRALLKYNEGSLASWQTNEGHRWQMYYLRWLPGRVSKFLAGSHYPTVCLPASGLQLVAETGPFVCRVGDLSLPFVTYLFDDNGRDVYVFHAIVEENEASYDNRVVYRQANSTERLRSVAQGERNLGQRVVGIAVTGPISETDARDTLQATLHEIITIESAQTASFPSAL